MFQQFEKRMPLFLALVVSLILVSACGTPPPTINDVDVTAMPMDQALLIFSTGAEETCTIAATSLIIKKADAQPRPGESIGMYQANNPFVKSDFEEQYGKVYTIALEPGDYDFWLMVNNATWRYEDLILTERIRVEAGQIRYIGEFFVLGCGNVYIMLRDQSTRDIEFLQRATPSLDAESVDIDLARIKPKEDTDEQP